MRPRGDSVSLPVAKYVGQAGKHSPQWMQASSNLGSKTDAPVGQLSALDVVPGILLASACPTFSCALASIELLIGAAPMPGLAELGRFDEFA